MSFYIIAIVGLAMLLPTCCVWSLKSRIGTSATPDGTPLDDLPSDATNISWNISGAFGPNAAYEFDTSEAGYQQWVENFNATELIGPDFGPDRSLVYNHATKSFNFREIDNAIIYAWSEEDRGLYLVYDQDAGRAYYYWHGR